MLPNFKRDCIIGTPFRTPSKDNIVYFSASSVASSDPIVSTDGLGSSQSFSTTVSSVEEQPYRPSFTRKWGKFFIYSNLNFVHTSPLIHYQLHS